MKLLLAIGSGSFIGGICRHLLSQFIRTAFAAAFPIATFAVNILGCLLIGILFAVVERNSMDTGWRLFLGAGILGGFTTFSAFSAESFALLKAGQLWTAAAYIFASVFLGLLATFAGYSLFKAA
jgi:fluoride exporter